jgi:hypothetical protein
VKNTKLAGDAGAETRVVILDSGEEAFAAWSFPDENGDRHPARLGTTARS